MNLNVFPFTDYVIFLIKEYLCKLFGEAGFIEAHELQIQYFR